MTRASIQIRGKRKVPGREIDSQTPPSQQQATKRHRPLREIQYLRLQNPRTGLNSLPPEILGDIFVLSGNVSLPKCDALIGAKLSHRSTLIRFCIAAFHRTWTRYLGGSNYIGRTETNDRKLIRKAKTLAKQAAKQAGTDNWEMFYELPMEAEEDPLWEAELQTDILNAPWATVDILLQSQQTWVDQYRPEIKYERIQEWPTSQSDLALGLPSKYDAFRLFEEDYHHVVQHWRSDIRSLIHKPRMHETNRNARVPTKLITGPWTEEVQKRIFWFYRAGHYISETAATLPWEVRLNAFSCATSFGNNPPLPVIMTVMTNMTYLSIPVEKMRQLTRDLRCRKQKMDDMMQQGLIKEDEPQSKFLDFYISWAEKHTLFTNHAPINK